MTIIFKQKRGRQLLAQYGYFFLMWFVIQVFYNVPIKNLTSGWLEEGLLDLVKLIAWLGVGVLLIRKTAATDLSIAQPFQKPMRQRPFLITLGIIILYLVLSAMMQQHTLHIMPSFKTYNVIPRLSGCWDLRRNPISGLFFEPPSTTSHE